MEITDYCNYKLSLALKACGFDEPCIAQWACEPDGKPILLGSTAFVFNNAELKGRDVTAPLIYQAQKWLREKKGIAINVIAHDGDTYHSERVILSNCTLPESREWYVHTATPLRDSYEQALTEGIKSVLELIKKGE